MFNAFNGLLKSIKVSSNLTAPTIFKLPVFDFRSLIWNFRETNRLLKSDGVFFVKKPFDRNWNSL